MPLGNTSARLWRAAVLTLLPLLAMAQSSPPPAARPVRKAAVPAALPASAPAGRVSVSQGGFSYVLAPQPAWVAPVPLPATAPPERAPMHYRLIDDQVRVEAKSASRYRHIVRVVNEPSGLGTASQIEIEFDPSYETLVLHRLEVVREGRRIDKLDRKRVELLQREKQLEQRVYDGRVTASIVLDDVRVGDEIDYAFSIEGQNPVFEGRFVLHDWLASDRGPAVRVQSRLLAPEARNIRHQARATGVEVRSTVNNGWRDTVFVRDNVPQFRSEPGTPAWASMDDLLQFTEFADWAEVAAWGERLFTPAATGGASAAQADAIAAAQAGAAERARAALDFVQREVRYFGIEIGPGTHRPHPADQVLQQRFGDCKDKVMLLGALLARLEIPSRPVLVSTHLRGHVSDFLPSPLLFDHVIARVDLDGKPLYVDPTRQHQDGPLAARQSVLLGRGLELAAAVKEPVALPAPFDTEWMHVDDRIVVTAFTEPPLLESRVVYREEMAEAVREMVSTQGIVAAADGLTQPYVKVYPKLRRQGAPELQPLPGQSAVALVQRFVLPEFWRFPEQRVLLADLLLWGGADALVPPKTESRRQPYAFGLPGRYGHRITLQFPEAIYTQDSSRRADEGDAHFSLEVHVEGRRDRIEYSAETRLLTETVPADRWPAFIAAANKALPKLGVTSGAPLLSPTRGEALMALVNKLEQDMKSGRVKPVTATQAQAQFKRLVLDSQLAGDRLEPRLRAQALVARGIVLDHLGLVDDGRRDFDAALALDPESIEALNGAAENARGRGDHEAAAGFASEVLKREPRDAAALNTRALARYFQGRYAEARADLEAGLADSSTLRRGYGLIWLALATQRDGLPLAPIAEKFPRAGWPSDWPRPVIDQLFDGGDPDALVKAAKAQKNPLEVQTEAWYYLGERQAAAGDARAARESWKRAVDLGVVEFVEYAAARQRLAQAR